MRHGRDLITGGQVILSGYVMSDESAGWAWEDEVYFCPQMVREALADLGNGEVTVRLNSEGGDPVAGEAIRSILAGHPGGVRIVVEGVAASAASLLLMGGARREMTSGSWIMIHDPSAMIWGTAEEMRAGADYLDKIASIYGSVYAQASGQTADHIAAMMKAETYLSPQEAVDMGFVHEVVDSVAPAASAPSAPVVVPADRAAAEGAMRASLNTYAALMRSKKPGPTAARRPRNVTAAERGIPAQEATSTEGHMPQEDLTPAPGQIPATPPAEVNDDPAATSADAVMQERRRATGIRQMAQPFMVAGRLTDEDVQVLIDDGTSVDAAGARLMATMAAREPIGSSISVTPRGRDETETRRMAMEDALTMRLSTERVEDATRQAAAREFMDYSLVEMAGHRLGRQRVPSGFAAREEMLRMAFHSTSDFPALFENALNRSLAARYASAQPTYRRIARQRSYVDFRDHTTVRVGDFPDLQLVDPQSGELNAGTFGESKEKTAVKAYGVQVLLSRQMMVNDSLGGIAQVLNDRGMAVARFEDKTFYAMMLGGANSDGPTLIETGRQVFNTTDKTKAGTAAAITLASLSTGRAEIRKKKSVDGAELELSPSILLCGPDKETEAQQIVAPIQAQQAGNVNPFAGTLSVAVTAKITGNAWYLFVSPDELPCFEWGLLDGYSAPRFRMEDPFGIQGTKVSLEHDFGCGATDYRGGWKNAGA